MNVTRRVITHLLIIVFFGASVCGTAQAQTKFFTWLRERIGERSAKEDKQAEQNLKWQKKHFADQEAQKEFIAVIKKTRCYTCHVKGEKRDVRNEFGKRVSKRIHSHLDMDSDEITAAVKFNAPQELQDKVQEAFYRSLDEALKERVDMEDKKSETFGEQWKRGELTIVGEEAPQT